MKNTLFPTYIFVFLICLKLYASDTTSVSGNLPVKMPDAGSTTYNDSVKKIKIRGNVDLTGIKIPEYNLLKSKLDYKMLSGLSVLYIAGGTYLHIAQSNAWWKTSERFHFGDDASSTLNFDNFAHFYSVNLLGHLFSGGYEASGMQALESTWFSSLSALAYNSYINLEDGFHQEQGFSTGDFASDLAGTAFYISQYYFPVMKNFLPKMSYWPSHAYKNGSQRLILDDYSGQKYWMAIRVKNFLPEDIARYWPSFINVAAGAALKGYNEKDTGKSLEFYLALDLDSEELPLYGPFWQFVKNTLNYFHFPMPGIRISPERAAFLLCF